MAGALGGCTTPAASTPAAPDGPMIAITIDDLPAHGPLPPGTDRRQVIDTIIAALRAANVPAQGFVNGGFGADHPQSPGVLAAWHAAGLPLGNHSFSHGNIDAGTPAAFLADIDRNEPFVPAGSARWFRYPFLAEGATAATRDTVRAGLKARGYRVAAVTMGFADYAWNPPFARCMAKGDMAAVASLEDTYLAAARDAAIRARTLSRATLGRDVPYVLLMHAGALDARVMARMIALYRDMGFRFVDLATAQADPFYVTANDLGLADLSPSLERAAAARGIAVPKPAVAEPAASLCS
ncbi:hypothetical protein ASE75_09545 [Sphingomonas sp. Leaf17]|nr:hypothetical protein ASE75_09545 [Sphingomonas sp. Leaf17]